MEVAAIAVELGWSDPIGLIDLDDTSWAVAVAVIDGQIQHRLDRLEQITHGR